MSLERLGESGRSARKFRFTRSGTRSASRSATVVNTLRRPAADPLDAHRAHQPGDLVAADVVARPPRRLPELVRAVRRDLANGWGLARLA
jgi:hypothetical protein